MFFCSLSFSHTGGPRHSFLIGLALSCPLSRLLGEHNDDTKLVPRSVNRLLGCLADCSPPPSFVFFCIFVWFSPVLHYLPISSLSSFSLSLLFVLVQMLAEVVVLFAIMPLFLHITFLFLPVGLCRGVVHAFQVSISLLCLLWPFSLLSTLFSHFFLFLLSSFLFLLFSSTSQCRHDLSSVPSPCSHFRHILQAKPCV